MPVPTLNDDMPMLEKYRQRSRFEPIAMVTLNPSQPHACPPTLSPTPPAVCKDGTASVELHRSRPREVSTAADSVTARLFEPARSYPYLPVKPGFTTQAGYGYWCGWQLTRDFLPWSASSCGRQIQNGASIGGMGEGSGGSTHDACFFFFFPSSPGRRLGFDWCGEVEELDEAAGNGTLYTCLVPVGGACGTTFHLTSDLRAATFASPYSPKEEGTGFVYHQHDASRQCKRVDERLVSQDAFFQGTLVAIDTAELGISDVFTELLNKSAQHDFSCYVPAGVASLEPVYYLPVTSASITCPSASRFHGVMTLQSCFKLACFEKIFASGTAL
ncbi:uncharacterized protein B0T23DRAFT_395409 [Neurospora hispaniola]|uniref:Uncharacterized protein n=1 Tax=Neurospora hispaniola TaxID=588809 RepID=A0AAJ0MT26_9PEZI|nr:hypothetical protein B0T23DRAFT_395409 [Neurospora hispaniola]